MKLFFSPGACSLAPHIVLREAQLEFDLEKVDLNTKRTDAGADFLTISDKGAVPALELDNGELLTEGAVIMQYIADQRPESALLAGPGTFARVRVQEWLNFISSEMHKEFKPLFKPDSHEQCKLSAREQLAKRFAYVEGRLDGREFLMEQQFTVADAYCFNILSWTRYVRMSLEQYPNLQAYMHRVAARPAVRAALVAEGLNLRPT